MMPFNKDPQAVSPDETVRRIVSQFAADERNTVVISSGRDRHTLEKWLGEHKIDISAEHGIWTVRCIFTFHLTRYSYACLCENSVAMANGAAQLCDRSGSRKCARCSIVWWRALQDRQSKRKVSFLLCAVGESLFLVVKNI